jgi:hypothetical protein
VKAWRKKKELFKECRQCYVCMSGRNAGSAEAVVYVSMAGRRVFARAMEAVLCLKHGGKLYGKECRGICEHGREASLQEVRRTVTICDMAEGKRTY